MSKDQFLLTAAQSEAPGGIASRERSPHFQPGLASF